MSVAPAPQEKRILCHCASEHDFGDALTALRRAAMAAPEDDLVLHDGLALRWLSRPHAGALLGELREHYVNLIVLDLRAQTESAVEARAAEAFTILTALDQTDDVESRFAFDRIVVILPAAGSRALDDIILRLGARGVRNVIRAPADDPRGEALATSLLGDVGRILRARRKGRRALCASGGGITGIHFELGTLKCLDDCLGGDGVNDFEMYFGISAGAIVSGPLVQGYTVDEFMAAIAGVPGGRLPLIDLRLFRLGHVDAPRFVRRAALAAKTTAAGLWSALTGRRALGDEELLFDYADLIAAPFRSDRFELELRKIMQAPGATNDFRRLPRPLYVGATDQDARQHVLFGDEEHAHIPISRAIQASLSINPAFGATLIEGRYYEDGQVTRTSNFVEAIRRGATLIMVVDPFVPYVAREPGFANRRGLLYNIDQDVRTISFTRYEMTRNWVLRQHPEVSSYTFVPANRVRKLMSVNPMDHRPYREIWRGAYLSMFNRLRALEHRLGGDLLAHGLPLDLSKAEAVAHRLERVAHPDLADFFPNQKVDIKQRPLCLERASEAAPAAGAA